MKFYPSDWRADQALRVCSIAARGLWVECLCIMHEAEPYGHLVINGRPVTDTQLSALTGTPVDQLAALLSELEDGGVFSRNSGGVIYSRRMTRDEKKARTARKNGQNGGNPTLCKIKRKQPSDKGTLKPRVKGWVKAQSPDSRVSESHSSSESRSPPEESDTNVARQSGAPPRGDYRFRGRIIRLRADDYDRWREIYHAAFEDFDACLQSADDWIAKQPENKRKGWFFVVSGMLRKRHEAELKSRARKAEVSECML